METKYGPSTPYNVFNQGAFGAASVCFVLIILILFSL